MRLLNPLSVVQAFVWLPFVISSVLALQACSSDPDLNFVNAQDTYNVIVQELLNNREAFSDEKWREEVLPLINAGNVALDRYGALVEAGSDTSGTQATLQAVIIDLVTIVEQLE